jgi:glycosyltransferase involved in cell wall biosynthesis
MPTVSVIIATFNRRDLLARTLAALEEQTYPHDLLEVVVIDNGSTDSTPALLEGYAGPLRLRHLPRREPMLVPHARNDAVAASSGEIIAFTDDDCRPVPGWVAALVAGFRDGIGIVQGRTTADPAQPLHPLSRSQWTLWEYGLYETCNIAYRRDVLDLDNGPVFREDMPERLLELFGPRFAFPFGEDVELAWRLRRSGVASRFSSTAVVHHEVSPPDVGYHLRRARIGTGWPLLVRRNPELRTVFLTARIWLGPQRPLFLLAALGAVLGMRRPAALALAAPWLWRVIQPGRPGWRVRLRALPGTAVIEAATTACLVEGSVKARSLVL